jgi:hypothetical protein
VQLRRASRPIAFLLGVLIFGGVGRARADGILEVRAAYYKERATRVEQPMLDAAFDSGQGGTITAHFLVDSITSASLATGAVNGQFTERRYEVGAGYTQELPAHVKVGADFRYSTESDYFSTWVDVHGEVALLQQNLRLYALLGHSFDSVTNGVAVDQSSIGLPPFEDKLGVNLISVGATQLLTTDLIAGLSYDLGYLDGYQANPYRAVPGGPQPVSERVPRQRTRHAVSAELRGYLPMTRTTAVATYRLYADDWGIVAHTPELRLIQEIVSGLELRLRYRYYTQSKADFYEPVYTQMQLEDLTAFVTEDEKLSAFHTQTLGGQLSVALSTFGIKGAVGGVRVDVIVEHLWQTTTFGDAWAGQLGVTVPFEY